MKKRKRKSYTLLFIPDDNGRTFSFQINRLIIYSIAFFVIIFFSGAAFLLMQMGKIGTKLQLTQSLIKENKRLKKENNKVISIIEKIESINHTSQYIHRLSAAVGENELELPIARITRSEKEKIFTEDSLDTFIDKVRRNESDIYNQISVSSVSRNELSESIPNTSPVDGWITKRFNRNSSNPDENHLAIDFAAQAGTLIRSTAPGYVFAIINDKYLGLLVILQHKYGFTTKYGHCMKALVSQGDKIKRGQAIALLGNTGRSSAPHVHYEILKNGKNVDPLKYIFDRLD